MTGPPSVGIVFVHACDPLFERCPTVPVAGFRPLAMSVEHAPRGARWNLLHPDSPSAVMQQSAAGFVPLDRLPAVNVWEAIAYTAPGIVAHQSALRGGEPMKIKDYGKAPA